jgi:hypothetical protein
MNTRPPQTKSGRVFSPFHRGLNKAGTLWVLALFIFGAYPASAGETLRFSEMYGQVSSLGIVLSDRLKSLAGQSVVMEGFMAPPLKPTLDFFVLTRVPMSLCPFCSSDADWPSDIVVVYLENPVTALPFDRPIRVEGRLELGTKADAVTGFVSLVRIYATRLREA